MSKRESYSDNFTGKADEGLRAIIADDDNEDDDKSRRLKRILLKIINNELTPRQKEIIVLYYFKDIDITSIGKILGISPQAVSAAMGRARLRIFRILKYYY